MPQVTIADALACAEHDSERHASFARDGAGAPLLLSGATPHACRQRPAAMPRFTAAASR